MPTYRFRDDFTPFKNVEEGDAQALGEETALAREQVERIERRRDGTPVVAQPDKVVSVLYDRCLQLGEASPFHKHLEWNNRTAADKYRQGQIRQIITHLCIVDDLTGQANRAFIHVTSADPHLRNDHYALAEVVSNVDLQHAVLDRCTRDAEALSNKLRDFAELFAAGRELRDAIRSERDRLQGALAAARAIARQQAEPSGSDPGRRGSQPRAMRKAPRKQARAAARKQAAQKRKR